ncbi:hypothetical protein ABZP36_028186 [Zizania latifolia]
MGRSPCCEKEHTNKGAWTKEEDQRLIAHIRAHGEGWSLIAGQLPGRTDNEIKNYWNTHIKRKLLASGIDPQTHRPLLSGNAASSGRGAATNKAPLPAPPHPIAAPTKAAAAAIFAVTKPPPVDSSDDGGRSISGTTSTGEPRCPDLNLDLSVGSTPSSPPAETPTSQRPVCLCYHLGFRAGEACSCQADSSGPHEFRYFRPLEHGQYI